MIRLELESEETARILTEVAEKYMRRGNNDSPWNIVEVVKNRHPNQVLANFARMVQSLHHIRRQDPVDQLLEGEDADYKMGFTLTDARFPADVILGPDGQGLNACRFLDTVLRHAAENLRKSTVQVNIYLYALGLEKLVRRSAGSWPPPCTPGFNCHIPDTTASGSDDALAELKSSMVYIYGSQPGEQLYLLKARITLTCSEGDAEADLEPPPVEMQPGWPHQEGIPPFASPEWPDQQPRQTRALQWPSPPETASRYSAQSVMPGCQLTQSLTSHRNQHSLITKQLSQTPILPSQSLTNHIAPGQPSPGQMMSHQHMALSQCVSGRHIHTMSGHPTHSQHIKGLTSQTQLLLGQNPHSQIMPGQSTMPGRDEIQRHPAHPQWRKTDAWCSDQLRQLLAHEELGKKVQKKSRQPRKPKQTQQSQQQQYQQQQHQQLQPQQQYQLQLQQQQQIYQEQLQQQQQQFQQQQQQPFQQQQKHNVHSMFQHPVRHQYPHSVPRSQVHPSTPSPQGSTWDWTPQQQRFTSPPNSTAVSQTQQSPPVRHQHPQQQHSQASSQQLLGYCHNGIIRTNQMPTQQSQPVCQQRRPSTVEMVSPEIANLNSLVERQWPVLTPPPKYSNHMNQRRSSVGPQEQNRNYGASISSFQQFNIDFRRNAQLPQSSPNLPRTSPNLPHTSPNLPHTSPNLPHTSPNLPHASPNLPQSSPTSPREQTRPLQQQTAVETYQHQVSPPEQSMGIQPLVIEPRDDVPASPPQRQSPDATRVSQVEQQTVTTISMSSPSSATPSEIHSQSSAEKQQYKLPMNIKIKEEKDVVAQKRKNVFMCKEVIDLTEDSQAEDEEPKLVPPKKPKLGQEKDRVEELKDVLRANNFCIEDLNALIPGVIKLPSSRESDKEGCTASAAQTSNTVENVEETPKKAHSHKGASAPKVTLAMKDKLKALMKGASQVLSVTKPMHSMVTSVEASEAAVKISPALSSQPQQPVSTTEQPVTLLQKHVETTEQPLVVLHIPDDQDLVTISTAEPSAVVESDKRPAESKKQPFPKRKRGRPRILRPASLKPIAPKLGSPHGRRSPLTLSPGKRSPGNRVTRSFFQKLCQVPKINSKKKPRQKKLAASTKKALEKNEEARQELFTMASEIPIDLVSCSPKKKTKDSKRYDQLELIPLGHQSSTGLLEQSKPNAAGINDKDQSMTTPPPSPVGPMEAIERHLLGMGALSCQQISKQAGSVVYASSADSAPILYESAEDDHNRFPHEPSDMLKDDLNERISPVTLVQESTVVTSTTSINSDEEQGNSVPSVGLKSVQKTKDSDQSIDPKSIQVSSTMDSPQKEELNQCITKGLFHLTDDSDSEEREISPIKETTPTEPDLTLLPPRKPSISVDEYKDRRARLGSNEDQQIKGRQSSSHSAERPGSRRNSIENGERGPNSPEGRRWSKSPGSHSRYKSAEHRVDRRRHSSKEDSSNMHSPKDQGRHHNEQSPSMEKRKPEQQRLDPKAKPQEFTLSKPPHIYRERTSSEENIDNAAFRRRSSSGDKSPTTKHPHEIRPTIPSSQSQQQQYCENLDAATSTSPSRQSDGRRYSSARPGLSREGRHSRQLPQPISQSLSVGKAGHSTTLPPRPTPVSQPSHHRMPSLPPLPVVQGTPEAPVHTQADRDRMAKAKRNVEMRKSNIKVIKRTIEKVQQALRKLSVESEQRNMQLLELAKHTIDLKMIEDVNMMDSAIAAGPDKCCVYHHEPLPQDLLDNDCVKRVSRGMPTLAMVSVTHSAYDFNKAIVSNIAIFKKKYGHSKSDRHKAQLNEKLESHKKNLNFICQWEEPAKTEEKLRIKLEQYSTWRKQMEELQALETDFTRKRNCVARIDYLDKQLRLIHRHHQAVLKVTRKHKSSAALDANTEVTDMEVETPTQPGASPRIITGPSEQTVVTTSIPSATISIPSASVSIPSASVSISQANTLNTSIPSATFSVAQQAPVCVSVNNIYIPPAVQLQAAVPYQGPQWGVSTTYMGAMQHKPLSQMGQHQCPGPMTSPPIAAPRPPMLPTPTSALLPTPNNPCLLPSPMLTAVSPSMPIPLQQIAQQPPSPPPLPPPLPVGTPPSPARPPPPPLVSPVKASVVPQASSAGLPPPPLASPAKAPVVTPASPARPPPPPIVSPAKASVCSPKPTAEAAVTEWSRAKASEETVVTDKLVEPDKPGLRQLSAAEECSKSIMSTRESPPDIGDEGLAYTEALADAATKKGTEPQSATEEGTSLVVETNSFNSELVSIAMTRSIESNLTEEEEAVLITDVEIQSQLNKIVHFEAVRNVGVEAKCTLLHREPEEPEELAANPMPLYEEVIETQVVEEMEIPLPLVAEEVREDHQPLQEEEAKQLQSIPEEEASESAHQPQVLENNHWTSSSLQLVSDFDSPMSPEPEIYSDSPNSPSSGMDLPRSPEMDLPKSSYAKGKTVEYSISMQPGNGYDMASPQSLESANKVIDASQAAEPVLDKVIDSPQSPESVDKVIGYQQTTEPVDKTTESPQFPGLAHNVIVSLQSPEPVVKMIDSPQSPEPVVKVVDYPQSPEPADKVIYSPLSPEPVVKVVDTPQSPEPVVKVVVSLQSPEPLVKMTDSPQSPEPLVKVVDYPQSPEPVDTVVDYLQSPEPVVKVVDYPQSPEPADKVIYSPQSPQPVVKMIDSPQSPEHLTKVVDYPQSPEPADKVIYSPHSLEPVVKEIDSPQSRQYLVKAVDPTLSLSLIDSPQSPGPMDKHGDLSSHSTHGDIDSPELPAPEACDRESPLSPLFEQPKPPVAVPEIPQDPTFDDVNISRSEEDSSVEPSLTSSGVSVAHPQSETLGNQLSSFNRHEAGDNQEIKGLLDLLPVCETVPGRNISGASRQDCTLPEEVVVLTQPTQVDIVRHSSSAPPTPTQDELVDKVQSPSTPTQDELVNEVQSPSTPTQDEMDVDAFDSRPSTPCGNSVLPDGHSMPKEGGGVQSPGLNPLSLPFPLSTVEAHPAILKNATTGSCAESNTIQNNILKSSPTEMISQWAPAFVTNITQQLDSMVDDLKSAPATTALSFSRQTVQSEMDLVAEELKRQTSKAEQELNRRELMSIGKVLTTSETVKSITEEVTPQRLPIEADLPKTNCQARTPSPSRSRSRSRNWDRNPKTRYWCQSPSTSRSRSRSRSRELQQDRDLNDVRSRLERKSPNHQHKPACQSNQRRSRSPQRMHRSRSPTTYRHRSPYQSSPRRRSRSPGHYHRSHPLNRHRSPPVQSRATLSQKPLWMQLAEEVAVRKLSHGDLDLRF